MKPSIVFFISLTTVLSVSAQTLPSLFDALKASGASAFADQINSDPTIAALYLSDQVQTVFAPRDDAYGYDSNGLGKRQSLTPAQQQALLLQCTQGQATLQSMRTLPGGSQIVTKDNSTKLKGKGQSVISDARKTNTTKTKRDISRPFYSPAWTASASSLVNITRSLYPPTWTASVPSSVNITRPLYSSTWPHSAPSLWNTTHPLYPPTWTHSAPSVWNSPTPSPSPTPLVQIFSGLGSSVNVIQADIPYAGGHIQITDGKFTLPASLSTTLQTTGLSTFASLASSANLTDTLDDISYSTFFIPSNEAFANTNASSPSAATAGLLTGHVVPDFVGYLPSLVNGSTLTTQAGSSITVTIQGDNYYINDAVIVASNIILENGVAHVIDKVLTPPQIFTGAASSTIQKGTMGAFATVVTAALFLAMIF